MVYFPLTLPPGAGWGHGGAPRPLHEGPFTVFKILISALLHEPEGEGAPAQGRGDLRVTARPGATVPPPLKAVELWPVLRRGQIKGSTMGPPGRALLCREKADNRVRRGPERVGVLGANGPLLGRGPHPLRCCHRPARCRVLPAGIHPGNWLTVLRERSRSRNPTGSPAGGQELLGESGLAPPSPAWCPHSPAGAGSGAWTLHEAVSPSKSWDNAQCGGQGCAPPCAGCLATAFTVFAPG